MQRLPHPGRRWFTLHRMRAACASGNERTDSFLERCTTCSCHSTNHRCQRHRLRVGTYWHTIEYRIISAGFLHFGLIHVGMNMLLLWQLGQLLEPALGRARFTLLYFTAMVGGATGALLMNPNGLTGGASGAVFGLMAAAAVGFQQRGVNPMRTGIGATLMLNLLITFAIPGISIGGHLGGALVGGVIGYAMLEPKWQRDAPWIAWVAPVICIASSLLFISTF